MDALGHFSGSQDRDVTVIEGGPDQLTQSLYPRWPSGEERMIAQYEKASEFAHCSHFQRPHFESLARGLDRSADSRIWQECVLGEVVEDPVRWQFSEGSVSGFQQVGTVVVHQC
ncbi:hypothetical protein [Rhodococcus sp. A14]|uniref:hypothetical protein n=1 Tax=Rhodococcus sp. A14 TaxID=1194106 RepID=UPI001F0D520F